MPLRIKLPSKERIIINGAVLENAGEATTIILHNHADILRRKEVMSEADAKVPRAVSIMRCNARICLRMSVHAINKWRRSC